MTLERLAAPQPAAGPCHQQHTAPHRPPSLAFVTIRPTGDTPDAVTVDAGAPGMSKAAVAHVLRQVADSMDTAALADGEQPIPYEPPRPHARGPATDPLAVYAKGLRDGAAEIDNDDTCDCGGCDSCTARALAARLRALADGYDQGRALAHPGRPIPFTISQCPGGCPCRRSTTEEPST
ncbi:hypothetical protein AB0G49_14295 [Streptomyces longwoodensis]|uniref:hypothetical protein n=1 Tax=Streptomyces longwoodensis TaxID=68231 RepID=UPI003405922F